MVCGCKCCHDVDVLAQGLRVGAGAWQCAEIHVVRVWFCDDLIPGFGLRGSGILEAFGVQIVGLNQRMMCCWPRIFWGLECAKVFDGMSERSLDVRLPSA
jgi:hypothetical protein